MTDPLESRIERFRLGRKMFNEDFQDTLRELRKEKPIYPRAIHETRVDGLNPQKDFWEGIGYLVGTLENAISHPKVMYKIYKTKDKNNIS